MKKIIKIIFCFLLLCVLVACQATPDNEIVQQKGDVVKQIENNTSSENGDFPIP